MEKPEENVVVGGGGGGGGYGNDSNGDGNDGDDTVVNDNDNERPQRTDHFLDGVNLEQVEEEIRLEKIRQTSVKFTWDYFSQLLRRNLMEKRFALSVDDRDDLIQAAEDMRKYMPSDTDRDLTTHLRHLAESLSCDFQSHPGYYKIKNADFTLEIAATATTVADGSSQGSQQISSCSVSWFAERPVEAPSLRNDISRNRWDLVHTTLAAMFHLLPADLSRDEKLFCLRSLECAEKDLVNVSGSAASLLEQINGGILGLCKARTKSSPCTIYAFVEPVVFLDLDSGNIVSPTDDQILSDIEPHLQLCVVPSQTPNFFSDTTLFAHGEWRNAVTGRQLPAAFCLRFSKPIIFSSAAIKKLSKIAAIPLNVEGRYNLYQYLLNETEECHELFVRLPGCSTQHYIFDKSMMQSQEDGILRQIPFAHLQDVVLLVNIIRTQLAHNAFFESLVRAHNRSACVDEDLIKIHIASSYIDNFELQFHLKKNLFMAHIGVSTANVSVSLECVINGAVLPESQYATAILTKTWSLPVMMRSVLRRGGAISLAALDKPFVMNNENVDSNEMMDVKVSQSWLFVPSTANSHNNNYSCCKSEHEYVVDERVDLKFPHNGTITPSSTGLGQQHQQQQQPQSLLALFKELEKVEELIPPQKPPNGTQQCTAPPRSELLAPRTNRIHSENTMTMNALSDLDAICDMAANIDDGESNVSEHSSRSSIVERCSPSANEAQRLRLQMPPQSPSPASERYRTAPSGNFSQLSPLDIARQRLAQQQQQQQASTNSNPTDVFEFDDPPRMPPQNAMTPGSAQQFHFPGPGQNPYAFAAAMQSTRGSLSAQPTLKRRGRGRKAGNMGDRMLDPTRPILDPNTGLLSTGMGIPPPVRKPRGTSTARRPRRPRKAPHMPASPAHAHQFAINRPVLQRSFSEMPSYPQMQPVSLSQENRSEISEFDGTEESSDDETDPPPPVRTLSSAAVSSASAQTSSTSATSMQQISSSNSSSNTAAVSALSPIANKTSSLTTLSSLSSVSSSSGGTAELVASSTNSSSSSPPPPTATTTTTTASGSSLQAATYLTHKVRKGSLEAVVGKLHSKTSAPPPNSSSSGSNSSMGTSNPYLTSDLYDDESEPVTKPPESTAPGKRDSPSISTSSPGSRMSPNLTKMAAEQQPSSGSGSDLKIMIKLKQQAPTRPAGPQQSSSSSGSNSGAGGGGGGIPSSMRLIGQPPSSSSRSKEEKALLRQKQMKEKNRSNAQDERIRKAKRERKNDLGAGSKKSKMDRPLSEQRTTTTISPKVEFPQALAFASLKNFKIPKVMENEKCESPTPTTTTPPAAAASSSTASSGTHLNIGQNSGTLPGSVPPSSLSGGTAIAAAAAVVSSSSSVLSAPASSSIFPPKPKSILKSPAEPPPPLFRGMGGMPPMLPGRRPLLPDPRNVMHHPPRNQFRPLVPPTRMLPPPPPGAAVMGGTGGGGPPNFMPPPPPASSSSGRWMALAPQRQQQPSPRNSPSEQGPPGATLDTSASIAMSKMQDSPTEGLKIVADDD